MKEIITYGINGFSSYMNGGTEGIILLFSLIYLVYLGWKRKKGEVPFQRLVLRASVVLFLLLLCPGANGFLKRLNPTEDATYLFQLLPTAILLGMVVVELYEKIEAGNFGRFVKPGFFVGVTALLLIGLTSPILLSVGRISFPVNGDKVDGEISNVVQIVGEEKVLLPERLAAQIGEVSATVSYANEGDYGTDENHPASIAQSGLESDSAYVMIERSRLSDESLATLDQVMAENNYSLATETKNYFYYKKGTTWEMVQHPDASGNQALFYTFYNQDDGTLIVIDGGWAVNEDALREVINGYGGHVTAWILTHFHKDHIDAFNAIYEDPQGIIIDDIYASNYDSYYDRFLEEYQAWDDPDTFKLYMQLTDGGTKENIHHPKRGDELDIDGLHFKFYNTYDEKLLELYQEDIPNNCGLVFRVSTPNDSVLFMGDMYAPTVGQWMVDTYGEELRSEYVNLCHHGNSLMPASFYGYVLDEDGTMLFDAPQWLMESEDHKAKDLAQWCDEMGYQRKDLTTAPNKFYLW